MGHTTREYSTLDLAFEFLNEKLFDGRLPSAIISFQRSNTARGHFADSKFYKRNLEKLTMEEIEALKANPEEWRKHVSPEIALNPDAFYGRKDEEILSTLAHEMVHYWQCLYGAKSRAGYHNKEWADKMESIGLIPSDTGEPGGKRTGQKMTHYIQDGGPFAKAMIVWRDGSNRINWGSFPDPKPAARKKKRASKTPYVCESCGAKAWGKPELHIVCGDCETRMEAEPVD